MKNAWVSPPTNRLDAPLRVFALPYAGGSASSYHGWAEALPSNVQFCPVHLPGRERRLLEPAIDSMPKLIAAMSEGIDAYLDRPYVLFGHSMGAVAAWELADALMKSGRPKPKLLIASGHGSPAINRTFRPISALPDNEFIDAVMELGGLPTAVCAHRELLELVLPALRADFRLCETYPGAHHKIDVPVMVFGGRADPIAGPSEFESWRLVANELAGVNQFDGDHFFINSSRADVLKALSAVLAPLASQYMTARISV